MSVETAWRDSSLFSWKPFSQNHPQVENWKQIVDKRHETLWTSNLLLSESHNHDPTKTLNVYRVWLYSPLRILQGRGSLHHHATCRSPQHGEQFEIVARMFVVEPVGSLRKRNEDTFKDHIQQARVVGRIALEDFTINLVARSLLRSEIVSGHGAYSLASSPTAADNSSRLWHHGVLCQITWYWMLPLHDWNVVYYRYLGYNAQLPQGKIDVLEAAHTPPLKLGESRSYWCTIGWFAQNSVFVLPSYDFQDKS